MFTRSLLLVTCVIAQLFVAIAADAQINGRVLDYSGSPVRDVVVDIWSSTRWLASRRTEANGRFAFSLAESRGTRGLLARRIGFEPRRIDLPSIYAEVTVRMRRLTVTLPELTVATASSVCPNKEDRAARQLWQTLYGRYGHVADTVLLGTELRVFSGIVPASMLGNVDNTRMQKGERGASGRARVFWRARIASDGYAWKTQISSLDGAYDAWEYPPLDSDFAQHFADSLFGKLNVLSLVEGRGEHYLIGFCSKDRRKPGIEGILTVSSDTALLEAQWVFRMLRPKERAGGHVIFAPADAMGPTSLLLPISGLYWRAHRLSRYFQRWQQYRGWVIKDRAR